MENNLILIRCHNEYITKQYDTIHKKTGLKNLFHFNLE